MSKKLMPITVTSGLYHYVPPTPEQIAAQEAARQANIQKHETRRQHVHEKTESIGGLKHTNLGDGTIVSYDVDYGEPHIISVEIDNGDPEFFASFTPAQVLNLLAWLKQEEETLQKLAKEQ